MKSINSNAPIKCSKTILINSKPEKIWVVLTNINQWSTWQNEISNSKICGDLKPNTKFDWKTIGLTMHSTLHTVEPFSQFGWTVKFFGLYAIHNWTLKEMKGQTMVSDDESIDGFLAGPFKKILYKKVEHNKQNWLEKLKIECEKSAN